MLVIMTGWPVSLIADPPIIKTGFIWQMNDAFEEKKVLTQKLGLDASAIKKIFYNTKTTILTDRYSKNVLLMTDLNYYFFGGHPRQDIGEPGYRMKFPFVAIIGFLPGVYISVKRKRRLKLWFVGCVLILFVSLFKIVDGWDMAMYPILGIITFDGFNEINKYKYNWILLTIVAMIGAAEIWRLIL